MANLPERRNRATERRARSTLSTLDDALLVIVVLGLVFVAWQAVQAFLFLLKIAVVVLLAAAGVAIYSRLRRAR